MSHAMHHRTPVLKVSDGRGLIVRHVAWQRARLDDQPEERVEKTWYDAAARTVSTWDPRLFKRLETAPATQPTLATLYSLSGQPLAIESVDSGWDISLHAGAGNLIERWDSRRSHWITDHDEFLRPIAVREQFDNGAWRTSERYEYAESTDESSERNLCGLLEFCFDGAGSQQTQTRGIRGQILRETRRFLQSLDLPDWPMDLAQRERLLEPGSGASTSFTHDATGLLLEQVDAMGNRQSHTYGKSGNLQTVGLATASGESHSLLHSLTYNAFAQIESQTAGNGVTSLARFDPADGRLQELLTRKASTELIQHLKYSYDPTGNVIEVEDRAQPIRYFANQRIHPVSHYEYDSLYQLINATGREIAGSPIQPELPDLTLIPIDANLFSNYTQRFSYDEAGNLLELRHEGNHAHTRRMAIDPGSNRALPLAANDGPPDFNTQFDANGNLQILAPGRPLRWTPCNQLLETVSLSRANGDNDSERYAYDVHGIRLRKTATARTRSLILTRDVRYLPGLEIHVDSGTGEQLEIIDLQAGRTRIRHLHWVESKPPGVPDNQIRYSVSDHLGSAALELDSEARMISHEGYFPFGGTAWWAGRSAVEASYKTIRYSGKERDASGLYYYGLRYYAPWLQRWINPDPGEQPGDLNRYRMVGNGPVSRVDLLGLEGFDFNILGVVFAIAGLLAGLVLLLRKRRPIAQQAEVDAVDTETARWKERFGLNDEEVSRVHALKADLPKNTKLGLHQSDSGLIRAFMLTTKLQLSVFNKYSTAKKFPKSEIQSARLFYTEIRPARERAPSPALRALQNVTSDSESATIRSRKTTTRKRMQDYGASESEASYLSASSAPSSRRGSVAKYVVEVGDFFESREFRRAVKTFPDADVETILRDAITKLEEQSGGAPHLLTTGQLSVDVKLGQGQSSGRGRYRLLFDPTGKGSWRPWGVANTHK